LEGVYIFLTTSKGVLERGYNGEDNYLIFLIPYPLHYKPRGLYIFNLSKGGLILEEELILEGLIYIRPPKSN